MSEGSPMNMGRLSSVNTMVYRLFSRQSHDFSHHIIEGRNDLCKKPGATTGWMRRALRADSQSARHLATRNPVEPAL